MLPVDQVDRLRHLARFGLYRHAVAQQVIDGVVIAVKAASVVVGLGMQLMDGRADLRRGVFPRTQVVRKQAVLDVAVAGAVGPVAQIVVIQFIVEEPDDPVLGFAFGRADVVHINLILPVNSSCIMPCFSCRALVSFSSRTEISASMSERTAAMAFCSAIVAGVL